jgi:hypothetical protein
MNDSCFSFGILKEVLRTAKGTVNLEKTKAYGTLQDEHIIHISLV